MAVGAVWALPWGVPLLCRRRRGYSAASLLTALAVVVLEGCRHCDAANTATVTISQTLSPTVSVSKSKTVTPTDTDTGTATASPTASLSASDERFTHLRVDFSSIDFHAGDEIRIRVSTVIHTSSGDTFLAMINATQAASQGDGPLELRIYELGNDTAATTCATLASSAAEPAFRSQEFGVVSGESTEMSSAAHFTVYTPASNFTVCVRYADEAFSFASERTWVMVQSNADFYGTDQTASGMWYFTPKGPRVRMWAPTSPSSGDYAPIKFRTDSKFNFTTVSTSCNSSADAACSEGDSFKIVPRGSPCTLESQGGTAYVGANMVAKGGVWTTSGLARYHEGTFAGGLGRMAHGETLPFSTVATSGGVVSGDAVGYLRLPSPPGEYEICFSSQQRRAMQFEVSQNTSEWNSTVTELIEGIPLWTKVFLCESDSSCASTSGVSHLLVLNSTMTWSMYDLTPVSWGIIRFTGHELRRVESQAATTLTPTGDAFRFVPNPNQDSHTLVSPGCFGTSAIQTTGMAYDGGTTLGSDPSDPDDTSLASNVTFGEAFVPHSGEYIVCYRKWDEKGKWRVLSFDPQPHPAFGSLNYTADVLSPGVYRSSVNARPYVAWEPLSNETRAESESTIVFTALFGGSLDAHRWDGYRGTAVRIVPSSRGCAGQQTTADLAVNFATEERDGGEPECSVLDLDTGTSCPGRHSSSRLKALHFQVRMPLMPVPPLDRVCLRIGWSNWISPPHMSEVFTNKAQSFPEASQLSGEALALYAKPAISVSTGSLLEGNEHTVYFTDTVGNLTTDDLVRIIPAYRPLDIGEAVVVTGDPLGAATLGWSLPAGTPGTVWGVTSEGYRLSFPDAQGGWRNAIFPPGSLQLEDQSCALDEKYYRADGLDASLQPYCESAGAGSPATAGIMKSPCMGMKNVIMLCAPLTLRQCNASQKLLDIVKVTPDNVDDTVPWDSTEENLKGTAAVVTIPTSSFHVYAFCYKSRNSGWLRLGGSGSGWSSGSFFVSSAVSVTTLPSAGTRLICATHQLFTITPSLAFTELRAKMVPHDPLLQNDNCLQYASGTTTHVTASASVSSTTGVSILLPEKAGEYWLCYQILQVAGERSESWRREGPYTLESTSITWESSGQLLNMGTANIALLRAGGLFNINPNVDMAKVVSNDDTCHTGGVAGIGPLFSTPVQKLITDLGPTDGLNSEASFVITLPPVTGDVPTIYHVCVYTFFVSTGEFAWVEVSHASGALFITRGSDIQGWSLDAQLQPHHSLGLSGKELAMSGASTVLPYGSGFSVTFSRAITEPVEFKFVKIGGPELRVPKNDTSWAWAMTSDSLRGCDPVGVHGTMSDEECIGGSCSFGQYTGGHRRYNMSLTLPDVGVYFVCLRFGNGSWLLVPSENGLEHLYTVPTYLEYERTTPSNLTVSDLRVEGVSRNPLASWCQGVFCGDRIKFAGYGELCLPPPEDQAGARAAGWFDMASYDSLTSSVSFFDPQSRATSFNFPPEFFHSTVVKVCLYKETDYGTLWQTSHANSGNPSPGNTSNASGTSPLSGDGMTMSPPSASPLGSPAPAPLSNGTNGSSDSALAYVTKRHVVYTLWNSGDPNAGGGSIYWKPPDAVDVLLVFSPKHDVGATIHLASGELLEIVVQPAIGSIPVIRQGVLFMVLCSDIVCSSPSAEEPFIVNNVAGCFGDTATRYGWESWGRRQMLNSRGQASFRFTLTSICPPFGCLVRFYAKFGQTAIWSKPVSIQSGSLEVPDGVTLNDMEVPTCMEVTATCNVTVTCTHAEECPMVIAARKNGPRLYAASGFVTVSHPPLEKNISTMGFGNPKTKAWNSKGVSTFILLPSLRSGVARESVVLDIVLSAVSTKITVVITRRLPAMALIATALPLDTRSSSYNFRRMGRVPAPRWIPLTSRTLAAAAPSSFLVGATGSYLQIGVPYELRFSVLSHSGKPLPISDKWLVRLRVTSTSETWVVGSAGGGPLSWAPPVLAHNSTLLGLTFIVEGGGGCSRLNDNKQSLAKALGQGCDFTLELNDTSLGTHLSSTMRSPVRIPATTLRVVLPGDSLFNATSRPSRGAIRAPVQKGVDVTIIPGTYVSGVFMNDEFHFGGIFALFGRSGTASPEGGKLLGVVGSGEPYRRYPLQTLSEVTDTSTGEVTGVWAARWVLAVDRPCVECVFSFHSEAGASPEGVDSFLTADFYDDTSQLHCAVGTTSKIQWKSDSFSSDTFTVTVEPRNSAGANTQWPRHLVYLDGANVVTSGALSLTEGSAVVTPTLDPSTGQAVSVSSSSPKVMSVRLQSINGGSTAVFTLKAYGASAPTVQTIFAATFTLNVAGAAGKAVALQCDATALLVPLRVTPVISFGIRSAVGAKPLCPPCNSGTCFCDRWLTDPMSDEKIDFHIQFWESTSLGTAPATNSSYNISVKTASGFPHWSCDNVGAESTCVTSKTLSFHETYVPIEGRGDSEGPRIYHYGNYGKVRVARHMVGFSSAHLGAGVLTITPEMALPARDARFEICTVNPPSSISRVETVAPPGCIEVRLWSSPGIPRPLSVGLLSMELSNYVASTPLYINLNSGGSARFPRENSDVAEQVCGHKPSQVRFLSVAFYTMPGDDYVKYPVYDREVFVTASHGYPAALLLDRVSSEARVRPNITSATPLRDPAGVEARFLHTLNPIMGTDFTVLTSVASEPITLQAETPGVSIAPYTTKARFASAPLPPGKYLSLQVLPEVASMPDCPSKRTMSCLVNSYITQCPDPGLGWGYVPALAGLPFPMQLSVENDEGRRSWSFPRSVVLMEAPTPTSGCGFGGRARLLRPRDIVESIRSESDFTDTDAVDLLQGVGVGWVHFSQPCQECLLQFTLCDPTALSAAACRANGLTDLPNGPPMLERVRVTKPFSVEKAVPTHVAVSEQVLPTASGVTPAGLSVIQVGAAFTVRLSSATAGGASGRWAYQDSPGVTLFEADIISKWIDSTVIDSATAKYGNGGFLAGFSGTVGGCEVSQPTFDDAHILRVPAAPDLPIAFSFTRPCTRCEVWVRYTLAGTSASFALRATPGQAKATGYRVVACGTRWLLAGTPLPSAVRRRPFSVMGWRVDLNNMPSWDATDTSMADLITPELGIGGNGGGGLWDVLSPASPPNASDPSRFSTRPIAGVAVAKLEASRACFSCRLEFVTHSHSMTVLTETRQIVAIPIAQERFTQGCCSNASIYRFTVFVADTLGDRVYTVGGPTPLPWHAAIPHIGAVSLSVRTPRVLPRRIAWRTDMPRESPSISIRGSCVVNGIPYGELCGEGTGPGTVEVRITGGPLTDFPLEFALSSGEAVVTSLWGSQGPPRVSRGIFATALEIDNLVPLKVTPGDGVEVPVYAIGEAVFAADTPPMPYVATLGLSYADVAYSCLGCPDCTTEDETVEFEDGMAVIPVVLSWSAVNRTSVACVATVTPHNTSIPAASFHIESVLTPRYTWAFVSSSSIHIAEPPRSLTKTVHSRVNTPVEVVLLAYTRFFERTNVGGYVDWGNATAGFSGAAFRSVNRRGLACFVTQSVALSGFGTRLVVWGHFTQLPCEIHGLRLGGNTVFPQGTAMYNKLAAVGTEPDAITVAPQLQNGVKVSYTGIASATPDGTPAGATGEPITILVHTTLPNGSLATGDSDTRIRLELSRSGVFRQQVLRVSGGAALFTVVLDSDTLDVLRGTHTPWDVNVVPANATSALTRPTGLPPIYIVRVMRRVGVEFRAVPIIGFPEEPWRRLREGEPWMVGYTMQLRIVALDSADPPNIVNFTGKVTLDPANIPCVGSDSDKPWLARTCLPPLQGSQKWRGGATPCTSNTILPCTGSVWSTCPAYPTVGSPVDMQTRQGVVSGTLIAVTAATSTILTSTNERVEAKRWFVHASGCLRGNTADLKSVTALSEGVGVVGSARYDTPATGEAYLRLVSNEVGVRYVYIHAQYIASLTLVGSACDTSLDVGYALCDPPFANASVASHTGFALNLSINDEHGDTVPAENYTAIYISAECISGEPELRLGRVGGISGGQVLSPDGWNVSRASGGYVAFDRLAFHGSCMEAVLVFSCEGVSPDMHGACARMNMTTHPFSVVSRGGWDGNFTGGPVVATPLPVTNPPSPPMAHPTLLVNMGDLDALTFSTAQRRALESTVLSALKSKSYYPDDIQSVFIVVVCSVPRRRAGEGLTPQDRLDPLVCLMHKAGMGLTPTPVDSGLGPGVSPAGGSPGGTPPVDAELREGIVLAEDCGMLGCATLMEFFVVVLNPSDPTLANDVFAAFQKSVNDTSSPLRVVYALDPAVALVNTSFPPIPPTVKPTPVPVMRTPLPETKQKLTGFGGAAELCPCLVLLCLSAVCTLLG